MITRPPSRERALVADRFSVVPTAALDDERISHACLRVLVNLGRFADRNGWCWPSLATLAEMCRIDRRDLCRHLGRLEALGYLRRVQRSERSGRQTSTKYQVVFDYADSGDKTHRIVGLRPQDDRGNQTHPPSGNQTHPPVNTLNEHPKESPVGTPDGVDSGEDLDTILYRRGKTLLGSKAGGQITKLKQLLGTAKALEAIETAKRKEDPAEYVAGVIRGNAPQPKPRLITEADHDAELVRRGLIKPRRQQT